VKSFEVSNSPVRSARWIARKQWIIVASDDQKIRVYNYNTSQKLHTIDEHSDYIRHVTVHPTLPYALSCSDDQTILMYDWDKKWAKSNTFVDHSHYVMHIAINPCDPNMFASASLDKTIKIWSIQGKKSSANYSLTGHKAGVNCVDFSKSFDKP
jgi:coatomer subunit beta'